MQDFRASGRGPLTPVGRLGGEVWTAREERQKNTYKADLQINGAPSRAAQQVLKECTAMGAGGGPAVVWQRGGTRLACLWPQSILSGRSTGVWSLGRQLGLDRGGKNCLCTPFSLPLRAKEV